MLNCLCLYSIIIRQLQKMIKSQDLKSQNQRKRFMVSKCARRYKLHLPSCLHSCHTASIWTFTWKKRKSNFKHSPRNYMPSESQNMFQINPRRSSEREITILSFSLFSESAIFQLEKLSTKIFLMNSIRVLFYSW